MPGIITAERARRLLHYDPDTGVLLRLISTSRNARAGDVAGSVGSKGYLAVKLDGRRYQTHRIIWLWMKGEWPKADIDHINGDRTDNRWCNLREATNSQNQANRPRPANNRSGSKGISWCKRNGKWEAGIKRHLGWFDTPGSAALAYAIAAEKYFGEFGRPTLEDTCLSIFMDAWRDARWKFDWVPVTGICKAA
jgi:hypothetical protein